MEAAVVLEQARALGDEDLLERVVDRRGRQARVDALERGAQAPSEDDFGEVVALSAGFSGATSGPYAVSQPSSANHSSVASSTCDSMMLVAVTSAPMAGA